MNPSPPKDLFSVANPDQTNHWSTLVRDLEKLEPCLLEQWKRDYDEWKHCYERFRQQEESLLFTPDINGDVPDIPPQLLQFHRRGILALLSSGERLQSVLSELPLDENEDQQERLQCQRRLRVLLDALQEGLDTWHRINAERIEIKQAS